VGNPPSLLARWRKALMFVKPDTVIAWHRRGFRLYWKGTTPSTTSCRCSLKLKTMIRARHFACSVACRSEPVQSSSTFQYGHV
jgi:hypothetical protein